MTTAIAVIVDVSIVTALALLACRALRRRPAALRHMLLAASLAAAAVAPLLEIALPRWELPVLSDAAQVTSTGLTFGSASPSTAAAVAIDTPSSPTITWTRVLVTAWGIGFVAVMGGLLVGLGRLVALTRRCRPMRSGAWRQQTDALSSQDALTRPVVILESRDRALLLTWGLFRPRIIVPPGAAAWTTERIQVVLAHELAHIRRRDWVLQIAAETLRAIYWFNPLVWLACRRLRDESELACDDSVLRRGVDAADYATHLLAVARHVIADGRAWAPAPAVANASTLERRIAAMLNASRNREPLSRRSTVLTLLAMLAVAAPLAAVTLTERPGPAPVALNGGADVALAATTPAAPAPVQPVPAAAPARQPAAQPAAPPALAEAPAAAEQQTPASLSGTVRDGSGAVLPGVELALTDTVSGIRSSRVTDGNGSYAFSAVPPSQYELVASLPGFATLSTVITLASGQNVQRSLGLGIGKLQETITVVCAAGAAAHPAAGNPHVAIDIPTTVTRLFKIPRAGTPATPPALAVQTLPVRVGGQILAPRKTKDVNPVCPRAILPSPTGTVVTLETTIGADGFMYDVRATNQKTGDAPSTEFVESAIEGVRQWQYTPTRLNNVPVPATAGVTVEYRRR